MPDKKTVPDAIPADFSNRFRTEYTDLLDHDITRKKICSVMDDYVSNVEFMEKVRKYAGMELDQRLFTSGKYWLLVAATTVLTAVVSITLTKIFG